MYQMVCPGSIAELEKLSGQKITDIHRERWDSWVVNISCWIFECGPHHHSLQDWQRNAQESLWGHPFEYLSSHELNSTELFLGLWFFFYNKCNLRCSTAGSNLDRCRTLRIIIHSRTRRHSKTISLLISSLKESIRRGSYSYSERQPLFCPSEDGSTRWLCSQRHSSISRPSRFTLWYPWMLWIYRMSSMDLMVK